MPTIENTNIMNVKQNVLKCFDCKGIVECCNSTWRAIQVRLRIIGCPCVYTKGAFPLASHNTHKPTNVSRLRQQKDV